MKTPLLFMVMMLIGILTSCGEKAFTETKVNVIFDNAQTHMMPLALFGEVPEALVSELGISEGIPSSVSVFLVEKKGKQLLFDAGNGKDDSQLLPQMKKLGITPEEVDYIFVTHMHGDHIGGLTKDGEKVFKNAQLYIAAPEVEAWKGQGNTDALLEAYKGNVVKFGEADVLPCDVEAIAAYGHTPGHTVYRVDDVLIVGDIMHGVALQMKNPEFCARFDMNHEQAIASRKAIVEKVKQKGWKMYGMHFPTMEGVKVE